jgi:hypothetical protein
MTDQEHVPKEFDELCRRCEENSDYAEQIETQLEVLEERMTDVDDELGERLSMSLGGLINTGMSPKPGRKGGPTSTSASVGGMGAISCDQKGAGGGDDNEVFI